MKFLIQKINGEIRHDFAFTLLESIRFKNWLNRNDKKAEIKVKFLNYIEVQEPSDIYPIQFKPLHKNYVPVGSVEFVTDFIHHFYGLNVKPINVPRELFFHPSWNFTKRQIFNGNHMDFEDILDGKYFVKSNTQIKGFKEIINHKTRGALPLPAGEYQVSQYLNGIESEWRAFVYKGKLVGLQNYCGEFTRFPNVNIIDEMIKAYKSAPIAYTLDIGVSDGMSDPKRGYFLGNQTFVIEVHDFFSCGLYGFADHSIYPQMLHQWFWQYIQREMVEQRRGKL